MDNTSRLIPAVGVPPVKELPQVTAEVCDLEKLSQEFDGLTSKMAERFAPAGAGQPAAPEPQLVGLAEALRRIRRVLQLNFSRLESMVYRAEL